jgi:hypothetical protein
MALLPARRSRHPTLLQDKSSLTDWEHYDSIFTAKASGATPPDRQLAPAAQRCIDRQVMSKRRQIQDRA